MAHLMNNDIVVSISGCSLPGGSGMPELVLVTAHLDSINAEGGAAATAPGADDSGR
jgi:hypothetical protein